MKHETKIFWSAMRIVYDIVLLIAAIALIIVASGQLISKELTQPDRTLGVLTLISMSFCAVDNIKAIPKDIQRFKDKIYDTTVGDIE